MQDSKVRLLLHHLMSPDLKLRTVFSYFCRKPFSLSLYQEIQKK